jgi:hypothetical protein
MSRLVGALAAVSVDRAILADSRGIIRVFPGLRLTSLLAAVPGYGRPMDADAKIIDCFA